jgi:hypothetical protein
MSHALTIVNLQGRKPWPVDDRLNEKIIVVWILVIVLSVIDLAVR